MSEDILDLAFFQWRCMYDRGKAVEHWAVLNKLIHHGRNKPNRELIPQFSDVIWESRKANQFLFRHELYSTLIYLLFRRSRNPLENYWADMTGVHTLLPLWNIVEEDDGRKICYIHTRITEEKLERLLARFSLGLGRTR